MKREKKGESIKGALISVKETLNTLAKEEGDKRTVEDAVKKIDGIIAYLSGMEKLALLFFFAFAVMSGLYLFEDRYNERITEIIKEKPSERIEVDSIARKILEIKESIEPDSSKSSSSYTYYTRNGRLLTYRQLWEANDSLEQVIQKRQILIDSFKFNLSLVESKYDLKFKKEKEKENGKSTTYYWVESKRIDSALLLLDVYRDKLSYDKERDSWTIKRP